MLSVPNAQGSGAVLQMPFLGAIDNRTQCTRAQLMEFFTRVFDPYQPPHAPASAQPHKTAMAEKRPRKGREKTALVCRPFGW